MNKDQLIELVNKLSLPIGNYSICSSGSLVMRDIQEKAGDLDLQVTEECFKYIKENYKIHFHDEENQYNHPLYAFDDFNAEFFVMPLEEIHFDYVDGYPCQDIYDILEFKKQRNLPKDQLAIKKILEYKNKKTK